MTNDIIPLDAAGYRKFSLVTSAIVTGLFGILIPWLFALEYPTWPWILAGVLGVWALILPVTLKPVYFAWMKFGSVMNWINTRLILGVLFYGMFLPFGVVMRLFGKDPMRRRIDYTRPSYRVKSHNDTKDHLERPY